MLVSLAWLLVACPAQCALPPSRTSPDAELPNDCLATCWQNVFCGVARCTLRLRFESCLMSDIVTLGARPCRQNPFYSVGAHTGTTAVCGTCCWQLLFVHKL